MSNYKEYCTAIEQRLLPIHLRDSGDWLPTNFDYNWHQQSPERMAPIREHVVALFKEAGLGGETIEDYRALEDILLRKRLEYFDPPNSYGVQVPTGFGKGPVWDSYGACQPEFLDLSRSLQYLSVAWSVKFPWKSQFSKSRSGFDKKEQPNVTV